jgi:hypothetical protein
MVHFAILIMYALAVAPGAANACDGPREAREATVASIQAFIHSKKMTVLTFTGYSGAQYQDPGAMLEQASRILDGQEPTKTWFLHRPAQARTVRRNPQTLVRRTSVRSTRPMVA